MGIGSVGGSAGNAAIIAQAQQKAGELEPTLKQQVNQALVDLKENATADTFQNNLQNKLRTNMDKALGGIGQVMGDAALVGTLGLAADASVDQLFEAVQNLGAEWGASNGDALDKIWNAVPDLVRVGGAGVATAIVGQALLSAVNNAADAYGALDKLIEATAD